MSPWPILSRLVLSACLILNGSGNALASTHAQALMPMPHVEMAAAADTGAAAPEPPCHRHPGQASASQQAPGVAATLPAAPPQPADCCKSGSCACTCMHHAQAALPAPCLHRGATGDTAIARTASPVHAAPALPQLIRPPIG